MLEDQQLNAELLLTHVQESCQLGYWHGGVELQETETVHRALVGRPVVDLHSYFNYDVYISVAWSTCGWWKAELAAALPQQRLSAAAGKVLCGSWGGRCRSLGRRVTRTLDRRS